MTTSVNTIMKSILLDTKSSRHPNDGLTWNFGKEKLSDSLCSLDSFGSS